MTWAEFKEVVEKQGIKNTDEVAYIDWTEHDAPVVSRLSDDRVLVE